MSCSTIKGQNWSVEPGGLVNLFGYRGAKSGDNWIVDFWGGLPVETSPGDDSADRISACIEKDTKNGRRSDVRYVIVAPNVAVILHLLGYFAINDLAHSNEHDGLIDIPGVRFGDIEVFLRVDPSRKAGFCATADDQGEIIP